jgi:2-polyprenyl-6-methoxyphenol hydroxylase-like FAD-dependent oxidoreductase
LRESITGLKPSLRDRKGDLRNWNQCSLVAVASDRLPRWQRPGLLLIGDAAHVMSPVGGNGINYAVQDAAAANILSEPLRAGRLSARDLAAVQRRRDWPTRLTQAIVTQIQNRVLRPGLQTSAGKGVQTTRERRVPSEDTIGPAARRDLGRLTRLRPCRLSSMP